jgi:hypothetical protein
MKKIKNASIVTLSMLLFSCTGVEVTKTETNQPASLRVKVLENSTITYCDINARERSVLRPLDTIWVNLATHRIDDTCTTAMKAVIYLSLTQ